MAKRSKSRIFWREQGGERRAYGDFREFSDVGGKREALVPEGGTRATTDPDVAAKLAADRVKELERARKSKGLGSQWKSSGLASYAEHHLRKKAQEGEVAEGWLTTTQGHLETAVQYFGAGRDLSSITPQDAEAYTAFLKTLPNGRGGTIKNGTVRKYLNGLSNMYRRAIAEGYAQVNPVAGMFTKPTPERTEANYFQPYQVGLLLESARTFRPAVRKPEHGGALTTNAYPWIYPLLATYAYTGGRKSEVLGLEVDDVSFRQGRIFFRQNDWRGLKTSGSRRDVPLWPELERILRAYMAERERGGGLGRLLFPSAKGEEESMLTDFRKTLDTIAARVGFQEGEVRLHAFRHSYIAARIQTLDRGAPVALYTVAREVGHKSTAMIEDRYGHLVRSRNPRSDELRYGVEDPPEEAAEEVHRLLGELAGGE